MYYDNKKLALSIFWVILGMLLIVLSVTEVLDSSACAGFGGGLTAVGALQIVRNMKYRKDPVYREEIDTEVKDERNSFLRMKSWSMTGVIVILAEGIGVVIAMILGEQTVQLVLSYSVCFILVVYCICYVLMGRKY